MKSKTMSTLQVDDGNGELMLDDPIRNQLYAEATTEGIAVHKNGLVFDVNEQFPGMLGYTGSELIGLPISDLIAPESLALTIENIKRQYDQFYEITLLKKNRSPLLVEVKGRTLLYNGEEIRVAIVRDITERKKNEEELRLYRENLEDLVEERTTNLQDANEKLNLTLTELERSNMELEQFAYVASHDLQEPLRKIKNFADLLAARNQDQLDDKALTFISHMVNSAVRMQKLIADLLTFSRISTQGKIQNRTSLESALQQAIDNMELSIQENVAKIQYEQLPDVNADEFQMIQLFQNLLGNAIKFRKKAAPEIQIKAKQRENEWIISVQDNGIGIATEYQERIFEIFQRLHTREEYPGTGIGLSVCKKIIEKHGGKIWMKSKFQVGSIFYFTIPGIESNS